jgi:hypothetical protein
MEVQSWPIEKLIPYARNPRKNDGAVDRMCASVREFGFKIPVLDRSDGEVVDGHLCLKAARKQVLPWPVNRKGREFRSGIRLAPRRTPALTLGRVLSEPPCFSEASGRRSR